MDQSPMDEADSVVARDVAREYEDLPEQWYGGAIPEKQEPEPVPDPSLWARLRNLWPSSDEKAGRNQGRLQDLDWALEHHPESPSVYVLRGEVYLEMGRYDLAADDFRRGLDYATNQIEASDWGLIAQALQERAAVGLAEANRVLGEH